MNESRYDRFKGDITHDSYNLTNDPIDDESDPCHPDNMESCGSCTLPEAYEMYPMEGDIFCIAECVRGTRCVRRAKYGPNKRDRFDGVYHAPLYCLQHYESMLQQIQDEWLAFGFVSMNLKHVQDPRIPFKPQIQRFTFTAQDPLQPDLLYVDDMGNIDSSVYTTIKGIGSSTIIVPRTVPNRDVLLRILIQEYDVADCPHSNQSPPR